MDIFVNNAGVTHKPKPMENVTEKEFDKVFSVNAKSVYYCAKFFIPKMKKNNSTAKALKGGCLSKPQSKLLPHARASIVSKGKL